MFWFYVMALGFVLVVASTLLWYLPEKKEDKWGNKTRKYETWSIGAGVVGGVFLILSILSLCLIYFCHAGDLGTIRAQKYLIQVQEERVVKLRNDLSVFFMQDNKIPTAFLNKDTPVKSITDQLAMAEEELAKCGTTLAKAKLSVAQRTAGPGSIIVSWFGTE